MSKLGELINNLCPDGVEYKSLNSLLEYEQPTKYIVKSTDYNDNFETPVLTAGSSFILGYTDETSNHYMASKQKPVIIFDDFTTGFHWVDFEFKVKSSAIKMLRPKNDTTSDFKYIYYAMRNIKFSPRDHIRHWISIYSKIEIPVPPFPVQHEIVQILDKMLDLTVELENELKARQKQYKYYREKLITFKRKE